MNTTKERPSRPYGPSVLELRVLITIGSETLEGSQDLDCSLALSGLTV
jgi:hypothetical protein